MEKRKKYIFRTIFGILSIIVAVIIFIFSSQNSTESSKTSDGVIRTIIEILKESGIITIKDLTSKSKTDLKNLTLSFQEINKIQIELQLLGLNLKGGL